MRMITRVLLQGTLIGFLSVPQFLTAAVVRLVSYMSLSEEDLSWLPPDNSKLQLSMYHS